ncbi:phosphatase PAP2 family protein [Rosistilla carotiformis]|uniref:phosphatase PAP2 family protein n=1 Tax=Rosistilla carotiformis TaxID=2528017 RepID=UPI0018D216F9|nr:phosphatase PAP2 family protein [Rosistilla carotiformis]
MSTRIQSSVQIVPLRLKARLQRGRRKPRLQRLEPRLCMDSAWQNPVLPLDVNDSGTVTNTDVVVLLNRINSGIENQLPLARPADAFYLDTNGDMQITPIDALRILNAQHRYASEPALAVGTDPDSDPDGNGVILSDHVTLVGQSVAGAKVQLTDGTGVVLESLAVDAQTGAFEFTTTLSSGIHELTVTVIDPLGQSTTTTRQIRRGNLATNWNATALNVVREWTTTSDDPYEGRIVTSEPPRVARNLAMIQTAMFDAIAAIEGGYETYLPIASALAAGASAEAAAIEAAYTVSTALYPDADSMAIWNAARNESLSMIADGPDKTAGLVFGESVGLQMLALRDDDGSLATRAYTHGDAPGDWQRTFPGYLPPLLPQWIDVEPFVVDDVATFRPAEPPALASDIYATSVDEVMRLGGVDSVDRTADQTEIAIFWADGGGTFTPPGHWNQIASDVLVGQQQPLLETARTLSLLNLAMADAGIAAWDTKYHYDLWRPIDAIQRADEDGNAATVQDAAWRPLLTSPPFPTYTSGHSTFSGAADAVLTSLLGENVRFTSQTDAFASPGQRPLVPNLIVTRTFDSFTEAAEEAGLSRIYGGIHFDFDNTAGLDTGRAIGTQAAATMLRPLAG